MSSPSSFNSGQSQTSRSSARPVVRLHVSRDIHISPIPNQILVKPYHCIRYHPQPYMYSTASRPSTHPFIHPKQSHCSNSSSLSIAPLTTLRSPQLVHLRDSLLEFLVLALLVTVSLGLQRNEHQPLSTLKSHPPVRIPDPPPKSAPSLPLPFPSPAPNQPSSTKEELTSHFHGK